jgi:hypothetical protein
LLAFLVAGVLAGGAALAGDNAPRPPASVPAKKSAAAVKGKPTELPPSALGYDDGKSRAEATGDDKPGLKIPNKFRFGGNTLHLDAEHRDDLPPGIDANEHAVLNHGETADSPLPSYFGLRLTTPMR